MIVLTLKEGKHTSLSRWSTVGVFYKEYNTEGGDQVTLQRNLVNLSQRGDQDQHQVINHIDGMYP